MQATRISQPVSSNVIDEEVYCKSRRIRATKYTKIQAVNKTRTFHQEELSHSCRWSISMVTTTKTSSCHSRARDSTSVTYQARRSSKETVMPSIWITLLSTMGRLVCCLISCKKQTMPTTILKTKSRILMNH